MPADPMFQDVLFNVEGSLGHITLNRPKALNALTQQMAEAIRKQLHEWETDPAVKMVLLDGAGERGLCAGGDIRALYENSKAGAFSANDDFFREEYLLNSQIGHYPKPFVAFMDGIVMGGGIGLSAHASLRIVTEKSNIAMPECNIGFFPDVGGTFLLGTAPGELGTHLGLTAGRVGAADAILCRLADYFVLESKLPDLATALQSAQTASDAQDLIAKLAEAPPEGKLAAASSWINECYLGDEVATILARLDKRPEPDAEAAAKAIRGNSPTSLKVTLRALREARALGKLDACLNQEYRIARAAIRGTEFVEGVRAAVVDKDRKPKWHPAELGEVDPADVERHFHSVDGTELGLN